MAEKITPRSEDFSKWYHDIVLNARLADYSPVRGSMVIRPNGYAIWEKIQSNLDRIFKETGVQNAYFPLLIPMSFIQKEADHVEGFAPELAIVTQAGGKELEEPFAIRPTSETIINSMFSKWVQSYRDLPLVINQWCNVMRWEMRTRLFLRTAEFLWQEGHTCHVDEADAVKRQTQMLEVYKDFCEEFMAMPVLTGAKSENERFAGAVSTFAIEALMQDRKALQAGTSHYLGQNFAKAFETKYQTQEGKEEFVHQTSWGVSTRLVGGLIMTHSDDRGLVVPPRIAPVHVAIVPILRKGKEEDVLGPCRKIAAELKKKGLSVILDDDDKKSPGWKFYEYEVTGVPVRIELGPRDIENNQAVVTRRDTSEKAQVSLDQLVDEVVSLQDQIQSALLKKAKAFIAEHSFTVKSYDEFKEKLDNPGGFLYVDWCGDSQLENVIKEETKATIRVIPFDQPKELGPCFYTGKPAKYRAVFARSY